MIDLEFSVIFWLFEGRDNQMQKLRHRKLVELKFLHPAVQESHKPPLGIPTV